MRASTPYSRWAAGFLCLALTLPSPVHAMRVQTPAEAGAEEALSYRLSSQASWVPSPAAGAEEPHLWSQRGHPAGGYQVHVGENRWIRTDFFHFGNFQIPLLEAVRRPGVLRPDMRALEIGTGEGPILIPLAAHAQHADGVEIHEGMAQRARENLAANGLTNAEVLVGDLIAPVRDRRYDLIVSNPAAIPVSPVMEKIFTDERSRLGNNGGRDGRVMIERILRETPPLLEPDGAILMVHPGFADLEKTRVLSQKLGLRMEIFSAHEVSLKNQRGVRTFVQEYRESIERAHGIRFIRKKGEWTFRIFVLRFTKLPAVGSAAGTEEVFEELMDAARGPVREIAAQRRMVAVLIDSALVPPELTSEDLASLGHQLSQLDGYPYIEIRELPAEAGRLATLRREYERDDRFRVLELRGMGQELVGRPDVVYANFAPHASGKVPPELLAIFVTDAVARWQRAQGEPDGSLIVLPAAVYLNASGAEETDFQQRILADRFA